MPFIVAVQISDQQQMFYAEHGEDFLLTPNRAKATRLSEERADLLAAAHNVYALAQAEVEGAKDVAEAAAP